MTKITISLPKNVTKLLDSQHYYYIPETNGIIYRVNNNDYYTDLKQGLRGRGTFGYVYLAYKIDIKSKIVDSEKTVAIKVLKPYVHQQWDPKTETFIKKIRRPHRQLIEAEIDFLRSYGEHASDLVEAFEPFDNQISESEIKNQPFYFFTMPYHDGKPVARYNKNDKLVINPLLAKCDFSQRIAFILQITMYLSLYHHVSPQTGEAIIHKDLQPGNVLLCTRMQDNETQYYAFIIDYGLATKMPEPTTANPTPVASNITYGTFISAAPELIEKRSASTLSDIYSFGMLIVLLLNGKEPYKERWTQGEDNNTSHQVNFEGFLEQLEIPGPFTQLIRNLLIDFTELTLRPRFDRRPTTNVCLLFFTLLNKYNNMVKYVRTRISFALCDYAIITTKLILIVNNLWDKPINSAPSSYNGKLNKNEIMIFPEEKELWANYGFDENPEFCIAISKLAEQKKITQRFLKDICSKLEDNETRTMINNLLQTNKVTYSEIEDILFQSNNIKIISRNSNL